MIQVYIDWSGLDEMRSGFVAAERTFHKPGVGVSYYRARKKLPGEKKKPARAWLILNTIAQRTGRDPLDPPAYLETEIHEMLNDEVREAIDSAFDTGRPQNARIKAMLLGGARDMREDAQERIDDRATGYTNAAKYARRKAYFLTQPPARRAPRFRHATREFGGAKPLILTGRLYHSMTERWYEMAPRRVRA